METNETRTARIEQAHRRVTTRWRTADWDHPYTQGGQIVCRPDGEPIECHGAGDLPGCLTCERVERDAAEAEEHAEAALDAARRGDWRTAKEQAEVAARIEWRCRGDLSWNSFASVIWAEAEEAEADEAEAAE